MAENYECRSVKSWENTRPLKLHELEEILEADDEVDTVILFPPDDGEITRVYIAVLLLTGYLTPQNIRMYWEIKSDTHNEAVANAIRRNRFLEIHQYLHLSDNTNLPENDKFGKVRKYLTTLSNNFVSNYENASSSHIAVDETMVPYYGRHGTKEHIHGKPIRFGYKLWSAASRNGYLICFQPYQGAKTAQLKYQDQYGLGTAVVLELESRLPKHLAPFNFYFDSFFTSFELLDILSQHNNGGTGTIRENRLRRCPLTESKLLKKEKRGSFSFKVELKLLALKWHDNSIVTLATNCHNVTPIQKYETPPQKNQSCGSLVAERVLPEVRFSGTPKEHSQKNCTQRRCGLCHQRTRIMCKQCKVGLHIHCWYQFHSQ